MLIRYKTGLKPRSYFPGIPHWSALKMRFGAKAITIPDVWTEYMDKFPEYSGLMLNGTYGICAEAAYYHMLQFWSNITNKANGMITEPDNNVLKLYELATGFNPAVPISDQGTDLQALLTYLVKTGAPTGRNAETVHKIFGFIEIDPTNDADLTRAIYECGCVMAGIQVPSNIMPDDADPPSVWDVVPGSTNKGGHCIVYGAKNKDGYPLVSWGRKYLATNKFNRINCTQAYAVIDVDWMEATGLSPLGIPRQELLSQMRLIQLAA